jgi:hypothetical protein
VCTVQCQRPNGHQLRRVRRGVTADTTIDVVAWQRITMVEALDQNDRGNGAYASVVGGGPGHSSVSLHFKSQRSHSINFVVQVYAR